MEIWKCIPSYPDYEVSDQGRVRSIRRGRLMKLQPERYMRVTLYGKKKCSVHVLVAEAFIGPRPDGLYVLHNDGDNYNNQPSNLQYGTAQQNYEDAVKHGTRVANQTWQSAESPGTVLTPDQVMTIVKLLDEGVSQQKIAYRFQVEQTTISHIHLGKNWAWLTGRRRQ